MIGKTVAHYKITGMLGKGGMGEVYIAQDTRLKRDIALKVLPADMAADPLRLERFQREAQTIAQLNHPHIVTLFSVEEADGIRFLTMELVEGRTLDQILTPDGLPIPQVLEIGIAVADALNTAHEKGIVHRDLKPANIMLTDEGRVKVLDFGLAKLDEPVSAVDKTVMRLTQDGSVLGTVPYMSPEQLRGQSVDSRSDIFALGTMLYELTAGRRPFDGASDSDEMSAILRDTPRSLSGIRPEVPESLGRMVGRCLEKDAGKRFQKAGDIRHELEILRTESAERSRETVPAKSRKVPWPVFLLPVVLLAGFLAWQFLTPGSPPDSVEPVGGAKNVIVVFPFENLGRTEDNYFAEGVLDEIISRLTDVSGIGVISRTTALGYRRQGKSLAEVAQDLGVNFVLDGTIRWDRSTEQVNRVRITPQLVRTRDGVSVWSTAFDRDLVDIFAIQSEIANQVAGHIDASLVPDTGEAAPGPTKNLEAYDFYLRARKHVEWGMGPTESQLRLGIDLLEKAVALDPDFAVAHARLSRAHSALYYSVSDESSTRIEQAEKAADTALEIAPDLAEAHLAKALYYYRSRTDYPRALAELELGRQLAPGNSEILSWTGTIRKRQGRFAEAADFLEQALQLDPKNPTILGELSVVYHALGEFEKAVDRNNQAIEVNPTFKTRLFRTRIIRAWKGDLSPLRQLLETSEPNPSTDREWVSLLSMERNFEEALARLDLIQIDPATDPGRFSALMMARAGVYWLNGDPENAGKAAAPAVPYLQERYNTASDRPRGRTAELAMAFAYLGKTTEARQVAEEFWARTETSKDVLARSARLYYLAKIQVVMGDLDTAVATLSRRLELNHLITIHDVLLDPLWDPLRDRPDFQALMQRHAAP